MVPGVAALELLLVKISNHAVWIGEAHVYPTGAVLHVELRGRAPAPPGLESGTGTWRFGIRFSDGLKATTFGLGGGASLRGGVGRGAVAATAGGAIAATAGGSAGPASPPEPPLLSPRGGRGSRTVWHQDYWLWPLPPPGELLVACQWPNAGIEERIATVGADRLREASARARALWPDPDPEGH